MLWGVQKYHDWEALRQQATIINMPQLTKGLSQGHLTHIINSMKVDKVAWGRISEQIIQNYWVTFKLQVYEYKTSVLPVEEYETKHIDRGVFYDII